MVVVVVIVVVVVAVVVWHYLDFLSFMICILI